MISTEATVLLAKGAELFILELTLRAWLQTEMSKRKTLKKEDVLEAISRSDMYDFLIDTVERVLVPHEGGSTPTSSQPKQSAHPPPTPSASTPQARTPASPQPKAPPRTSSAGGGGSATAPTPPAPGSTSSGGGAPPTVPSPRPPATPNVGTEGIGANTDFTTGMYGESAFLMYQLTGEGGGDSGQQGG